eukprot:3004550-Rhodomonas_salina.4
MEPYARSVPGIAYYPLCALATNITLPLSPPKQNQAAGVQKEVDSGVHRSVHSILSVAFG